jgi:transposase InsO family protein
MSWLEHPTAEWTAQQRRNAFSWDSAPRYLLRDRDRIFGDDFTRQVHDMGMEQVLCAPRSPWHRAYIERVIGTIRRECLDHGTVNSYRGSFTTVSDPATTAPGVVNDIRGSGQGYRQTQSVTHAPRRPPPEAAILLYPRGLLDFNSAARLPRSGKMSPLQNPHTSISSANRRISAAGIVILLR